MTTKKELVETLFQQQMRVPVSASTFDPKLARIDTAVKSIWQLYRWERWELLESLGVKRLFYEPIFHRFDEEHITSDHGLLDSDGLVYGLLKMTGPQLVARCLEVVERYQMMNRISRQAYYDQNRIERQI